MGERIKEATKGNTAFRVCLGLSIALIIGGALTPPMFVIDKSIFIATGELFAFAALYSFDKAIDRGVDAKFEKNGTKITIDNPNGDDEK